MPPAVSVIVLNYNGRKWAAPCLDAVLGQQGAPAFEVLFVDNASTDGSVPFVRQRYPAVRTIETGENLGFAAGNNAGARDAAGDWLAFLNNDTVAAPDWLARLWAAAQAHPEFDLVTSRLVFLHDPSRVDSAGDGYYRAGGAFKHGHGAPADAHGDSREVFGACGGAFLIRRHSFEALGGFDPRFFMVYEDVDLSYRARLRGMRVWYAADAVVRHAGSGSIGTLSDATVYYGQRNLEWTWIKNTPAPLLVSTLVPHLIYSAAGVAHYAAAGRGWAAVRGKLAAIAGLPELLRERRQVQGSRRADARVIAAHMEPRWLSAKRREKAFDAARVSAGTRAR